MSDFESLRSAMDALRADLDSYNDAVARFVVRTAEGFAAQDAVASELRDDVHALANRIESVARSAATPFDPPEAA